MKIILIEDVENLGRAGEIVEVADGYGRNYLIPKHLALAANVRNIKNLEHQKKVVESRVSREQEISRSLADKIDGTAVEVTARVGEEGKLFGSITSADIAEELVKNGFEVDRKQIQLDSVIKSIGEYRVKVRVASGMSAEVVVTVSPE